MSDKVIMPCPLCKFKSYIDFTTFGDSSIRHYRIRCEGPEMHALDRWDNTPEEAIEAWNSQVVNPTVSPERLAEIIIECTQKCLMSPYNKNYKGFMLDVATLISKTLDIREKE